MLDKLKEEVLWVMILIATQIGVFSYNYRDFETKFRPVVTDFEVVHVHKWTEDYMEIDVAFDKLRDCDFAGIRVYTTDGIRIRVDFLDRMGDQYHSRHVGENIAGPWRIWHDGWSELQLDVLHSCDPFGTTRTVMQRSSLLN